MFKTNIFILFFLLIVALYGGFFGAGLGILLLAYLAITDYGTIHEINALKNLLSATIYSTSVIVFIGEGVVSWEYTSVMIISASIGGYVGALVAKKMPLTLLKNSIVLVGIGLSLYYFIKLQN